MTESEYDKLSYPQTLDTITNRTIVPDSPDNSENASDLSAAFLPYASQMKEYSLPADFLDHKTSKKSETVRRELPETLPASTILLLSFDVKYNGEKDMSITINGIRNRLSGSEAPYPNNNDTFYYMISSNEDMDALDIMFSRGEYKLTNIKAYTLPLSLLSHPAGNFSGKKKFPGKRF